MRNLTAFIPVFTTGMSVDKVYKLVKNTASEIRNRVSSASQTKIDTFLQKFSISDCQAVCETIEQLSGGFIRFTEEEPKRSFSLRVVKPTTVTVQATSAEEALEQARNQYPDSTVSLA